MNRKLATVGFLVFMLAGFVAGLHSRGSSRNDRTAVKRILYYVDPMHPAYHSDRPGIAPDCGMPMEPVYEEEDPAAKLQLPEGAVSISLDKQRLIGLRVEPVRKNSGSRLLRTTGRVEADDNRVYRLMPGAEGWVQSLENNPPGTIVKKNELLASFYSREFRNAEQAYLGALASVDRVRTTRTQDEASKTNDSSIRSTEEQLHALGMGDPQIQELAKTRQITRDIAVVSPVDGVVLTRDIAPQQRFEAHTEIYRIADLSSVWLVADAFGDELIGLKPGMRVRVRVRELSTKTFYATVSQNPPWFDPASRTLKLRLTAANPGLLLRPSMFVDLEFSAQAPAGISVPEEAVLDSGRQKIVYVETREGVFEPRPVEVGTAYGNRIAIMRGLTEGEQVVTSGNFLIDSESRMRSVAIASPVDSRDTKQQSDQQTLATRDPVCEMTIDQDKAHATSRQAKNRDEPSVFGSEKCQIRDDPAKFAVVTKNSSLVPRHSSRRGD
jgi:Cu(I)/Ag(I) efflux system membrane fusion protein